MHDADAARPVAGNIQTIRPLPTVVRWLRLIGIIEGVSTLTLFGIAMPLKYAAGLPLAVTI